MPFPQGGDFPRSVVGGFNIVSSDPKLDQGDGVVYLRSFPSGSFISANLSAQVLANYPVHQILAQVQKTHDIFKFSTSQTGSSFLAQVASSISSACFTQSVPSAVSSFWRMAQFNPGVLPHLPDVFSDLYVFDVFSSTFIINSLVWHFIETLAARILQDSGRQMSKNVVQTDYYTTVSGQAEICEGDERPPFITYIDPTASGLQVRPRNQAVDFSLSDAVAGVDISTVFVSLTRSTSGTLSLVENGVDQTGGDVSITGDASSYRFRYVPPFLWDNNDLVVVTISGADLVPTVGGNPFFCGQQEVNHFVGDLPFQVENIEDISAQLTADGDIDPPYISTTFPTSGTSDNSVFTPVQLRIADDLTGVNLSTVVVSIDGKTLVNEGVASTSEVSVGGSPAEYTIHYNPDTAFSYGSTAIVSVYAEDRVETASPNILDTSFNFSFIEDSTLIIENFQPTVGTHTNLENVDIQVDIRDDTYGVDEDQTFFVINGTIVSGTRTPLASGIQMKYHPPNDFAFTEPINVTVHGTNNNISAPAVKEQFFTLFFGCRLFLFNEEPYEHGERVDVFVRARNLEDLRRDLSTGYFFTAYTQPQEDIGASIFADNPIADLPASLTALAPEHRYGQTVTVEFSVEDFDGNLLGPYTFTYTIEDRPGE